MGMNKMKENVKEVIDDKNKYVNKLLNNIDVKIINNKEMKPRKEIENSIKIANKKHIEEKKAEKKVLVHKKVIEEKIITLEEKNENIKKEMDLQRRSLGIVFNSENMVKLVVKQLENNKKITINETNENKRKIAAKVLVDSFVVNDVKYDKNDWKNTVIESIHMGKKKDAKGKPNEIIYLKFKEIEEIKMFKNQLKTASEEINNRIIPYVSHNSYDRFQAIDNLAYESRRRGLKTKIIFGKYDFLLLTKDKKDPTNWYNIPPRILEDLPEFNVGQINEDDKIKEEEERNDRRIRLKEKYDNLLKEEYDMINRRNEEEAAILRRIAQINVDEEDVKMDEESNNEEDNAVKRKNNEEINEEKKKTKSTL